DLDFATVQYDASGRELWVTRYNGPGNQAEQASALAVDAAGNVFVTGASKSGSGNYGYATVKYDSTGVQRWVSRYDNPGDIDQIPTALVLDKAGNVYITGGSGIASSSSSSGGGGGGLLGGLLGGVLGLLNGLLNAVLDVLGLGNAPDQSDFVTIKYHNSDGGQVW